MDTIHWSRDADGVVTLTIDDPDRRVNTMHEQFMAEFGRVIDRLADERDGLTGVILASGKSTFFAGGDLRWLYGVHPDDAEAFYTFVMSVHRGLRRLETLGVPVVAALNGSALGGGFEIALAAHHRIAIRATGARFGQPEVTLGLLPGGGGVVRVVRMLGVTNGLTNVLLEGQELSAERANELGLVGELVDSADDLIPAARAWIHAHPDATQPWDTRGYTIPGGTPATPSFAQQLPALPATLRKQLKGAPMPAPRAILAVAVESTQVPFDRALEIEARAFTELVTGQVAKNMIKASFFDMQAIHSPASRADGADRWQATRVAVLGAGMMGAGIAHACAGAGIDVVLKDVSMDRAEQGKRHSVQLTEKAASTGRMTDDEARALLDRIVPTDSYADLEGCDLVIEAVFESTGLKHQVLSDTEAAVLPDAVLASNTSTIPITILADGVSRPADFIGLHFFSPVHRMPLVEIIAGELTSEATVAKAIALVQQIAKTPIVVNDSRGFFTSRVIGTYVGEALTMLAEGVNPTRIDRAATMAGYPVGPLQLLDELTLTLLLRVAEESRDAADGDYLRPNEVEVLRSMVELGREGRSSGAGFFDYDDHRRLGLWPGLTDTFPPAADQPDIVEVQERMLFREALESVRCIEEGVLRSVPEANVGSILGIGFPAWTGGVIQYIDGYQGGRASAAPIGVTGFVARAKELADRHGERFLPPTTLVARAETGEPFSPPPF